MSLVFARQILVRMTVKRNTYQYLLPVKIYFLCANHFSHFLRLWHGHVEAIQNRLSVSDTMKTIGPTFPVVLSFLFNQPFLWRNTARNRGVAQSGRVLFGPKMGASPFFAV